MKRFFFFLIFFLIFSIGNTQTLADCFIARTDSLSKILFDNFPDQEKMDANRQLEILTHEFLMCDTSLHFGYDSLRYAKRIVPEDESFTLLTWVVPLTDYEYHYSGFLQKIKNAKVDTVFQLKPGDKKVDQNASYEMNNWPSAVYNQVLPKGKKENYYTLFGWVGKSEGLAGKVIETLAFDSVGQPVFGVSVFSEKNENTACRISFEYTNEIPFHLSYELQKLPGEKRKTGWMIVFNRIGGNAPGMGKMFRGPVPSFEVFDAFVKIKEKWVFFEDVDPRVDSKNLDNSPPTEIGLQEIKKKK